MYRKLFMQKPVMLRMLFISKDGECEGILFPERLRPLLIDPRQHFVIIIEKEQLGYRHKPFAVLRHQKLRRPSIVLEVCLADSVKLLHPLFKPAQEQLDLVYLQRALNEAHGNQKVASGLLGLTYDQFRGLYRKYKNMLVLG